MTNDNIVCDSECNLKTTSLRKPFELNAQSFFLDNSSYISNKSFTSHIRNNKVTTQTQHTTNSPTPCEHNVTSLENTQTNTIMKKRTSAPIRSLTRSDQVRQISKPSTYVPGVTPTGQVKQVPNHLLDTTVRRKGIGTCRDMKRKSQALFEISPDQGDIDTRAIVFGIEQLCMRINPDNALPRSAIRSMWEATTPKTPNSDNNELRAIVSAVQQLGVRLRSDDPLSFEEIRCLWEEASAAEQTLLTLEKANEAAEGFKFPADIALADEEKFESVGWDFTALARLRISELASDRINEPAIRAHIDPEDPDFENLLTISRGVRVATAPDFKPNLVPPPLRRKYISLQAPINKSIYKNYMDGKTIILKRECLKHIKDAHFSLVHCNFEPKKLRVITDCSNAPKDTHPLNSKHVKESAKTLWGKIAPVTIDGIIAKIYLFMLANPGMVFELFKMDMASAFSLFTMHAEDIHLLGFLLTNDLIQFEITGSFGKTDYPYVFSVFTNVVRREGMKRLIKAIMDMYVDDVMGISIAGEQTTANLAILKTFVESVWGKGSISDAKTLRSLSTLDMIGYEVDIIHQRVRMSQSNRFKMIRVLSRIKETDGLTILDIMRVASYATRYTKICLVMAPFTCHIYNMLAWRTNLHRQLSLFIPGHKITRECKWTIQLWRCIITFMELRRDDARFYRTFASFLPHENTTFRIEFDASLEGAGVIVSRGNPDNWSILRVIKVPYSFDLTQFEFKSTMQNTCEFIAAIIGLTWCARLGAKDGRIKLVGDSKTALRWSETWSFRAGPSNNAAVVYVALGLKYNLHLDDTVFIRGEDNKVCDGLSRDRHPSTLGFDNSLYSDEEDEVISRLLTLCAPSNTETLSNDFVTKWVEAACFADSLESPFEL